MRSGIRPRTQKPTAGGLGLKALVALTIAALGAVMIPASAQAAVVVSQGEGRLLTASLGGVDIAPLLALNGASAINPFGTGNVVSDVPLDATALSALNIQTNGVNLFGDASLPLVPSLISLGAVGQYAAANNDGSSVAFSGAVSEAPSLVGVGTTVTGSNVGTPGAGDSATISVGTAQLLGGPNLVSLDVGVGALAASAQQPVAGAATGDYALASIDVGVGGTLLAAPLGTLSTTLGPIITAVNGLAGTTIANPFSGGEISVSLADLLAASPYATLSAVPPGTNLLVYLPAAVVAQLTDTVNTLVAALQTELTILGPAGAATGLLLAGVLTATVNPLLLGLSGALAGPLGAAIDALLQLNINNQTTNPDGSFTQNALTIGIGAAGALASVRLANATVGPNAGPGVPPVITSLTPTFGPTAGGTLVTITGGGFTGATGVTFGGTAGGTVTVVNDTTITVLSPPHAAATVDVIVQHPNGASNPGSFTFVPPLTVTQIDPNFGPEAGGTVVTITGTCLAGATGVLFDGVAGTAFSETGGVITVTTPAHAPGFVDVTIQGSVQCGTLVVPNGFQFISATAPVITGMNPTSGPDTGGTVVTITGTGFTGATGVTFDGLPATGVTVVSNTQITATSPAHPAGPVNVVVQHPNGPSAPFVFTYTPGTTIITVNPPSGPQAGGTTVTITGTCFTGATGVFFGSVAATSFTVLSATQIRATTPPGVGVVNVTVVGAPACGSAVAPNAFSYIAPGLAFTGFTGMSALLIGAELVLGGLVLLVAALIRRRRLAA